ncbi:MAG: hypothetical protein IKB25_14020 [Lentisphaeria bacterium]|nr:hypothetical protein [Lentisphaeria bacterium]
MIKKKTSKTMWSAVRPLGLFAVVFALSAGLPITVQADKKAATEESDAKMAGLVDPILNDAISLYKANKYEQALAKCKEIDTMFARTKHLPSTQITAKKTMVSQLKSEIQAKWGAVQMADVRKMYTEADRLFTEKNGKNSTVNEKKAIERLNDVIARTTVIAAKNPGVAAQARTLQAAAKKYMADKLAWGVKNAAAIADRERFVKEKVDPLYNQAVVLLNDNLYKKSYTKLMEAVKTLDSAKYSHSAKVLEVKSRLLALKDEIVRKWEIAYVMDARKNYLIAMELAPKDIKKAVEYAKRAQRRAVEGRGEIPTRTPSKDLQNIEEACARFFKSADFVQLSALPEDEINKIAIRKDEINSLLAKGDALFRRKLYSEARNAFEKVYTLDPFNEQANIMLSKIYRKINDTAWLRRENEILERIDEVEWKWILPSRERHVDQLEESPLPDDKTSEKASIYKKLQDIIYPGADFEDENVTDVFSQIQRRSRELDPEKKGVPIFYPAFKEDKFVTLKVGQMPIGELIRYVCMYSGLKYKVTPLGVEIGGSDLDDMREQTFTMSSSLFKNITGVGLGETKNLLTEEAGDDLFGSDDKKDTKNTPAETATSTAGDNDSLKMFFVECGVPFGEGSAISYNDNVNKLTVRNTPENLKTMAMLLEKIDVETELVLVEAKIIEIAVSDLEELGFDWTLTHNNTNPRFLYGNSTQVDSSFGSTETYSLGEAVINQVLVRHTGSGGSGGNFSTEDVTSALNLINNLNIIPNFGENGAYNMFLTVHAVDQSSRGEVIAAPKVLAKSGKPATIQMVQQMYFPEEWEEAELEEGNNTFEYTPPVPEMGEAVPIGTNFTVTPTVGVNLRTITLDLSPSITALTGWTDYDYQFIIGSIRSVSSDSSVYAAKMKMPEISERALSTQLKIYDGDTVVLGGVLQENAMKRDDKYPFLGEIPLVGTLFSNKASRSTKQNLLIFVTPRLIRYDGMPVNPVKDNGRFDFNR